MQISSFIGKPILSPAGSSLGYVLQVYTTRDMKKISCLVCADDEEEEFYLPARAMLSYGDAVLAGKARLSAPSGIPSPIGKTVFAHTGEKLGTVTDLQAEADASMLMVTREGEKTAFPADCAAIGETVIVYPNASAKPTAGKRTSPRKPAGGKPKMTAEKAPIVPEATAVHSFNRVNLLGRRVKKSVFDGYGTAIAVAGERITPSVISAARKNNRLLELTMNTLTNLY